MSDLVVETDTKLREAIAYISFLLDSIEPDAYNALFEKEIKHRMKVLKMTQDCLCALERHVEPETLLEWISEQ